MLISDTGRVIRDLDIRLLRHFVAVAEDLHFTRAAERLYVSQQSLSRDLRKLEDRLGTRLLDRTSRQVRLTPDGERLLRLARPLINRHDDLLDQFQVRGASFTVDVVGEGITPARVLAAARRYEAGFEYYPQYGTGLAEALTRLDLRTLDAAFGLVDENGPTTSRPSRAGIAHRLVRVEALGLLLPEDHPLAGGEPLPIAELQARAVCHRAGNHVTAEWVLYADRLLSSWNAHPVPDHPPVRGSDIAYHLRPDEPPILVPIDHPRPPGAVVRSLVDPVPVVGWSMLWRATDSHPALDALHHAIDDLGTEADR